MNTDNTKKTYPDFDVYHVKKIGEDKSKWTQISVAWMHKDGDGLNIDLDCFPKNGQLVLRRYKPKVPDQVTTQ